jgi:hypothetical protein
MDSGSWRKAVWREVRRRYDNLGVIEMLEKQNLDLQEKVGRLIESRDEAVNQLHKGKFR